MLIRFLSRFQHSEDGAVTVDWVVLTAALILLPVAVAVAIGTETTGSSEDIGTFIETEGARVLGGP